MPRITLWNNGKRGADFTFIDRQVSEFVNASGTALYVYLYQGTYDENGQPTEVTEIQDVLFQENRDRIYGKDVIEMRGCYNVQDNDFDLRQFGFFLSGDTIFMEVHLNDMLAICGRKIISGDVIELPHQRDDAMLDGGDATNRFYVVEDATRAANGYSQTWFPHLWRLKMTPMTDSQEYADILDRNVEDPFGLKQEKTIKDVMSIVHKQMDVNEAVVEEAEKYVKERNFETRQFYFVPGEEKGDMLPWIWAGDGDPPNGAELIDSGVVFPEGAADGSFFLKTSFSPHQLYKKEGGKWRIQEVDYRMGKWTAAHRLLDSFINNCDTTILDDGTELKQKIALSRALPPPADF